MRTQVMARAVGIALLGIGLVSCSSSTNTAQLTPSWLTVESATDWFGKASEIVYECQAHSKIVDDEILMFANSSDSSDISIPIVLAAGQAVEDCTIGPDSADQMRILSEMDPVYPEATALLRQWIDQMRVTNTAVLVAAASNLDSRQFVSEAFDGQHRADELANQLEQLIMQAGSDLGIDAPVGEVLYHWNPPGH